MKVTLIALPWIFPHSTFQRHEGFSQNLGIGYLGAYAEKHGHDVFVIDAFAEGVHNKQEIFLGEKKYYLYGLTPEETINRIPEDSDIIGISCPFNSQAYLIEVFASKIKGRYPKKLIVLGGSYAISFPREALSKNVDVVVRGEGEIPLLEILSGMPLSAVRGILYEQDNVVKDNGIAPIVEDMDTLPFPARHLLPMDKYFERSPRGGDEKRKSISITTSRGCPFNCNFCSLHNLENEYARGWRARSPENVMAEIDQLVEQYGEISLQFEDDNILINKVRAKELFSLLRQRNVKWAIHSGVMINLLDEELIRLMKKSGCEQLNVALESGNSTVLKAMNKKVDLKMAAEVVKYCRKYKINILAFLMVGYPGETKKTFQETLAFLKRLRSMGLKKIAPFIVNPHRGTLLYEDCKQKGYLRNSEDAVFNSDVVCIETEDFDAQDVREWVHMVSGVMYPYRWRIKRLLRGILPQETFNRLITIYHRLRDNA